MKRYFYLIGLFISHLATAQININGDQYHLYGPNPTWGAHLQVGGNGRVTEFASVVATNGNLHLDARNGNFSTYINHYSQNNTLINTQGGNVGIGNYNPTEKLEVEGNIKSNRIRIGGSLFHTNSRSSFNSFNTGNDPSLSVGWIAADFGGVDNNSDRIVLGAGFGGKSIIASHNYNLTAWGGPLLINPYGGNVGIGNYNPTEKLEVEGNIKSNRIRIGGSFFHSNSRSSFNSFNAGSDPSLSEGWIAADFGGVDNNSDRIVLGAGFGGKAVIATHNFNLSAWGGSLLINPYGGNVGIGATNPDEKLTVKGKIHAEEVRVDLSIPGPDYVFKEGYKLTPLSEIQSFIKINKHLPEVPSAKEMEEKGINLSEMNMLLLKKVEELTLYILKQEERIEKIEKQNRKAK